MINDRKSPETLRKAEPLITEYLNNGYKIIPPGGQTETTHKRNISTNSDGSITSEGKFIADENKLADSEYLLKLHNYNPDLFEIVNSKASFWDTQLKGGKVDTLYSSKITVKPKLTNPTTLIDNYFKTFTYQSKPIRTEHTTDGDVLEICLTDLHSGLLSWREETGADYDINIVKDRFNTCINDILSRCQGKTFKKIIIAFIGDILHIDNNQQTTTKGTFQQTDGRLAKIFNNTLDMLIDMLYKFAEISVVEVISVRGNHDEVTGYALMKAIEMYFKNENIFFDNAPNPRKARLIGNSLIGWTHGDMPKKNMNWLHQEFKTEYGQSKQAEIHCGHFHSQQTTEENGVIIRYLPTICAASYWEHQQGFSKSVKTMMSFVWGENGLRDIWYSSI